MTQERYVHTKNVPDLSLTLEHFHNSLKSLNYRNVSFFPGFHILVVCMFFGDSSSAGTQVLQQQFVPMDLIVEKDSKKKNSTHFQNY